MKAFNVNTYNRVVIISLMICIIPGIVGCQSKSVLGTPETSPVATDDSLVNTPTPKIEHTLTQTMIPTQTETIPATLSVIATPEIFDDMFGEMRINVGMAGFSVSRESEYFAGYGPARALFQDEGGSFAIQLMGETNTPYKPEIHALFMQFLDSLGKNLGVEFALGEESQIEIDGYSGVLMEVSTKVNGKEMPGQIFGTVISDSQYFFGFGMSQNLDNIDSWNLNGKALIQELLPTIRIIEISPNATCEIASDATYGYSEQNPIKVGGGIFGGASRETSYLDTLQSPSGNPIEFERTGSIDGADDTILDVFESEVEGNQVKLFIDMYNFEEPLAPVGLSCISAFPLE